jgi:hypothetical protein
VVRATSPSWKRWASSRAVDACRTLSATIERFITAGMCRPRKEPQLELTPAWIASCAIFSLRSALVVQPGQTASE